MISQDLVKGAKGAAAFLGPAVNANAIYHMVRTNRLPVIRMGKSMFFRKSELEAVFQSQATNG
ncbi:helix-turn-helix domain-containing protein [Sphingobium yanoikuyae]|uniref:helix-turn-helix domain-containing protein n=1 Tax=Sphingobium yanoikuyae TaxID=13690 RepID=UPI0024200A48|nr:helix-turn-helix domain-containing protein [Sphingobium yanoikuyae]